MAPYDANLTDDWNPVGQWDWWVIYSDAQSPYLTRPEHDGDRRLVTASTVPAGGPSLMPSGRWSATADLGTCSISALCGGERR